MLRTWTQIYSICLTFAVCIISHEYHFDQYNDSFNVSKQKISVFLLLILCYGNIFLLLPPDSLVCVPESHRGGKSHGHDGVPWHRQHPPARVLPVGARHVQNGERQVCRRDKGDHQRHGPDTESEQDRGQITGNEGGGEPNQRAFFWQSPCVHTEAAYWLRAVTNTEPSLDGRRWLMVLQDKAELWNTICGKWTGISFTVSEIVCVYILPDARCVHSITWWWWWFAKSHKYLDVHERQRPICDPRVQCVGRSEQTSVRPKWNRPMATKRCVHFLALV